MPDNKPSTSYKDAGVDIDAGNKLVEMIKPLAKATARSGADADLGGFGGLFDLAAAGYQSPVLVSATDGVGTKLKVAIEAGKHDTVGIDLVAMCVNDLITQGAEPLLFLDYFATGRLDVNQAKDVIAGIAEGCKQAGAALVGGETAEMPGMYKQGDYDLAGFAVGAVEKHKVLPKKEAIFEGDVLIGLPANGIHSNGYSLVRHIIEKQGLALNDKSPFSTRKLAEELLEPTKIYAKALKDTIKAGEAKALAHITGGGITENVPRILPEKLAAEIDVASWKKQEIFKWLQKAGNITNEEMLKTFNCGIGMVIVVSEMHIDVLSERLKAQNQPFTKIGKLIGRADSAVVYKNIEALGA